MKIKKIKTVKIKCPKCGNVTNGKIIDYEDFPFLSYHGFCDCGYRITESEFEEIS